MDWFLYDNGLCHERVKGRFGSAIQILPSSDDIGEFLSSFFNPVVV